jgi:hypothetical protein
MRYYFDIREGEALCADEEGMELRIKRRPRSRPRIPSLTRRGIHLHLKRGITWLSRCGPAPDLCSRQPSSSRAS